MIREDIIGFSFFFASLFSFELDVESEPKQIVHSDADLVVGLRARMF